MTYAVTGASGQLGRLVAERLVETVDPREVVLLTRSPDALADLAARGADVRRADFDDPTTLGPAFAGVDRLLIVSTDRVGSRLAGQLAAVAAAVTAGVDHVLYTSVTRPEPDNPAGVVPDHAATEQALADSGLSWTTLRNNLYADMQVDTVRQAAASGRLVTNTGSGGTSYVTRADCAAAAVGALTQPGRPEQVYEISGPAAITAHDLAALATELRGTPVEVVDVDDAGYTAGLESVGLPAPVAGLLASFGTGTRLGFFDGVTDAVARLSGTAPTPLRDLVITD